MGRGDRKLEAKVKVVCVGEMQFGFVPGKEATFIIFVVRTRTSGRLYYKFVE